jgi:hypothetical protein
MNVPALFAPLLLTLLACTNSAIAVDKPDGRLENKADSDDAH